MQKINYDLIMQNIAKEHVGKSILLHACCAPCSSSVLKTLASFFRITIYYYNPNIDTIYEYNKRKEELERLTLIYNREELSLWKIELAVDSYNKKDFEVISKGMESCREGGERCKKCYALRLFHTYHMAQKHKFDFFCSTLSLSPHKNANIINNIGLSFNEIKATSNIKILEQELKEKASTQYSPLYLPNDFKKRNGYLDSIKISKELGLYRQDYCGCIYSKKARENLLSNAISE